MFFVRRFWAIKIIERSGIEVRSAEATWLIGALIWAAKKSSFKKRLTKRQAVLISALTMADNKTAWQDLCRVSQVSPDRGLGILVQIKYAARRLASECGETALLEVHCNIENENSN